MYSNLLIKYSTLLIILLLMAISCEQMEKSAGTQVKSGENSKSAIYVSMENAQWSNLMKYVVKQEFINKDKLGYKFEGIFIKRTGENTFELRIEAGHADLKDIFYKDYYLVFSIYPEDNQIDLLSSERRKYNFESFSMKIFKEPNGKLISSREIQTRLMNARAVTVTLMSYKSKEKQLVLVLQKLNFLS